jgi:hypothetical protein|nr:MAG TPA: hypothetical protein [Caudoviricetes sp.]
MDLSGFQMCHLSDDAHSILREKRVILGLACRVIEALGMDITDFYHGEYAFGEEVYSSPEGLRYKKTGKFTSEDVN